jgi:hypothetical protein
MIAYRRRTRRYVNDFKRYDLIGVLADNKGLGFQPPKLVTCGFSSATSSVQWILLSACELGLW